MAIPAGLLATRIPHCRAQYGQWVAVDAALMRHRNSKMPSGPPSPEVIDTTAILAAFEMSDRRGQRDENVPLPWNRRQERGRSVSEGKPGRRSICFDYGFNVIIVFLF
jgi:hypothetical protein